MTAYILYIKIIIAQYREGRKKKPQYCYILSNLDNIKPPPLSERRQIAAFIR